VTSGEQAIIFENERFGGTAMMKAEKDLRIRVRKFPWPTVCVYESSAPRCVAFLQSAKSPGNEEL
jgi:hypothetical protein